MSQATQVCLRKVLGLCLIVGCEQTHFFCKSAFGCNFTIFLCRVLWVYFFYFIHTHGLKCVTSFVMFGNMGYQRGNRAEML